MNWTPVVIVDFLLATIILVGGLWSLRYSENVKIKTIKYLRATWITLAIFYYLEAISFLFLDLFWGRIYGLLGFVAYGIFIIAINYNFKDKFLSIWLFIVIAFGCIATYLAFQPDAVIIETRNGYYQIIRTGYFEILISMIIIVFALTSLGWIGMTAFYSPYLMRKNALYYFFSLFIQLTISIFVYFFVGSLFWSAISTCISISLTSYIIHKNPGIFYILPFKAYRLTVLNNNGDVLVKYVWSKTSSIDLIYEILLATEFKNIEKLKYKSPLMEEKIEKTSFKGKLRDMIKEIKYPKGYKISHDKKSGNIRLEMKYPEVLIYEGLSIIVKFEVSKITHFLRDLIEQFSNEFENQFRENLEKLVIKKENYEVAYQLIDKYFFMFPTTIVTSPKESFLISPESFRIEEELEHKIRELFPEEEDFNFIKYELQQAPEITLRSINKMWGELHTEKEAG